MKPDTCPTLPPTTISAPLSEMPHRDEQSPSITIIPPCPDAPTHSEALPLTRISPDMIFSPTLQPTLPCTAILDRLFIPPMKYPAWPRISISPSQSTPTAMLCIPRGLRISTLEAPFAANPRCRNSFSSRSVH